MGFTRGLKLQFFFCVVDFCGKDGSGNERTQRKKRRRENKWIIKMKTKHKDQTHVLSKMVCDKKQGFTY